METETPIYSSIVKDQPSFNFGNAFTKSTKTARYVNIIVALTFSKIVKYILQIWQMGSAKDQKYQPAKPAKLVKIAHALKLTNYPTKTHFDSYKPQ